MPVIGKSSVASNLGTGSGIHPPHLNAIVPEISVRIIGLLDADYMARLAHVRACFANLHKSSYEYGDTQALSQLDRPFDAIILHGDDIREMAAIVHRWRRTFSGKAIIAFLTRSDPNSAAELLNAGCDTVLDLASPPDEAAARVEAILRRTMPLQMPEAEDCQPAAPVATSRELGAFPAGTNFCSRISPFEQASATANWGLTEQECEVFARSGRGMTSTQIGHELGISAIATEMHRRNIVTKARRARNH